MVKYMKKTFYFFFYFINILGFFLKGLLLTKTIVYCSIIKNNLINIISFLKYNLLAGFSSLLDIIVVDMLI
jgi:hypothetical protein